MSDTRPKKGAPSKTPEGAEAQEKIRSDDRSVRDAVTTERNAPGGGTQSVLPGPPIPPSQQDALREKAQEKQRR